jgi:hypothetical protein
MNWIGTSAILGSSVFAAADTRAAEWTVSFKIAQLDGKANVGGYEVVPATNTVVNNSGNDPANCVPSSSTHVGRFYMLDNNTPEGRELMAKTLLAAYLSGKPVKLYVSSAAENCNNSRPMYSGVAIYQ